MGEQGQYIVKKPDQAGRRTAVKGLMGLAGVGALAAVEQQTGALSRGATAIAAALRPTDAALAQSKPAEKPTPKENEDIYGKILDAVKKPDGSFEYRVREDQTDQTPSRIETFTPVGTDTTIVVRTDPTLSAPYADLDPRSIGAVYARRIAGSAYPGRHGDQEINGQRTGVWVELTDENGESVAPNGAPLAQGSPRAYVAANFVTFDTWTDSEKGKEFAAKLDDLKRYLSPDNPDPTFQRYLQQKGLTVAYQWNLHGKPYDGTILQPVLVSRAFPIMEDKTINQQGAKDIGDDKLSNTVLEWPIEVQLVKPDGTVAEKWAARDRQETKQGKNGQETVRAWVFNAIEKTTNGKTTPYIKPRVK